MSTTYRLPMCEVQKLKSKETATFRWYSTAKLAAKRPNETLRFSANTLEVSGLVYLARNYIAIEPQHSLNIKNSTTGTVNASRNSFTLLRIDLDNLTSLYL
jgi:hypothetical protein